jgi:adenine-specific DNA-methyltransferase
MSLARAISDRECVVHRGNISEESKAMNSAPDLLKSMISRSLHVGNSEVIRRQAESACASEMHGLARFYFSRSYFSTTQAIALDAFREAVDTVTQRSSLISWRSCDVRDLLLATWLSAASSMCNSPGHTGQFLRGGTTASRDRIRRAWSISPFEQYERSFARLLTARARSARLPNRVCIGEASDIAGRVRITRDPRRTIFYADPPYTKDHYSRLYHVLETLYRYDYPDSIGVGRTRSDRFLSNFSYKTRARAAVNDLANTVISRGSKLILSYPSGGLIPIDEILADLRLLGSLEITKVAHRHSSLGGRHGNATKAALEYMVLVQP